LQRLVCAWRRRCECAPDFFPSWELFRAQGQEYQDLVLPSSLRARLAVETGIAQGWERWTGDQGDILSIERYGASAPYQTILKALGFTVDEVIARARALLKSIFFHSGTFFSTAYRQLIHSHLSDL
jgi:hypothetical protein